MLTTLVASSKGGCGKSTLVTQLASHWAQAGQNTAIVDADRQGSSYRWAGRRPDNVPGVLGLEGGRKALQRVPPDTRQLLIDTAAGSGERELEPYIEEATVLLVPVLPSSFDLDATTHFLDELQAIKRIRTGKLPVALVANRLKPWTRASQEAVERLAAESPFPVVAQLRDSQAYVLLTALGKGIFDYQSEQVRNHQEDWKPLLRWIKRHAA
ncbi:MAG: CMP-binding protein [Rhodanobacter sp. 68-29]|uniref:ParA family protein n=1 Tax=Rhodanobacter sp. PCA2 TaxID=2006117 RepID=UPI00086AF922|nr:ParA family protein [Rhodanobacter sp. PCA2]MBA2080034.1 CMP-binding protein [Rhodanobacter sp. PCA2]MBN8924861.1 ParA family protein [Rhodanobacter sp.]ODU73247.1 MAG: CMP-binding protein [Rhodanobacter sp. SCN 69-32]OJY57488.1 MAG: CMP-binding protein [Rhodanobacter sp. 68-29]